MIRYTWRAGPSLIPPEVACGRPRVAPSALHRLGRARDERRERTGAASPSRTSPTFGFLSGVTLPAPVPFLVRSLGDAFSQPPATPGQRRASATHPTRLETRTEESWPFASRRGPL